MKKNQIFENPNVAHPHLPVSPSTKINKILIYSEKSRRTAGFFNALPAVSPFYTQILPIIYRTYTMPFLA